MVALAGLPGCHCPAPLGCALAAALSSSSASGRSEARRDRPAAQRVPLWRLLPVLAWLAEGSVIMYQSPARSLCSALSNFCCAPSSAASSSLLRRSPAPVRRALSPPALLTSAAAASSSRCGRSAAAPGAAANPPAGEYSGLSAAPGPAGGKRGEGFLRARFASGAWVGEPPPPSLRLNHPLHCLNARNNPKR